MGKLTVRDWALLLHPVSYIAGKEASGTGGGIRRSFLITGKEAHRLSSA
jgi:hypothetical protein